MSIDKITNAPTPNEHIAKTNEIIDVVNNGGSTATDVQVNGTSITSNNVADIQTNGTYNASSNKIATMSDVPDISGKANDNDVVHLADTETITGEKKFRVTPYVWNSAQNAWDAIIGSVQISNYFANKTLSNLGATSSTNFDGQFVQSYLLLSTNTKIGNYEHYLGATGTNPHNYLPDNDYVYMVYGQIVTNSNTSCRHWLGTGSTPATNNNCFRVLSRTASNCVLGVNYFALPVVPNSNGYQILYEQIDNANAATNADITLMGYRRIGTNN